jgi:DNA-binding NarL/FixJ family response regulator
LNIHNNYDIINYRVKGGKKLLKTVIPESKAKIEKQIKVLENIIEKDIREKDREIHTQALNALKEGLKALEKVENAPSPAGRKKSVDSEEIKRLRAEGKTQEQIARELNISLSTVRRNQ